MSAHTPGRSPDISPSRLVTTAEYGQWDIPVQHHHLNSQQLRVVWIETESPHHAGRARREQVVERLELLEIIRMGKVRSEVETSLLAAI